MQTPTPEALADDFVRRWLSHESTALRDLGRREIATLIRQAIEAAKLAQSDDQRAA
jgi:hypothetical protein